MIYRFSLMASLLLTACLSSGPSGGSSPEGVTAYTGASIFNGETFQNQTLCVREKTIVHCPRQTGDTVIDLSGLFITPPFGDAHTHHFDGHYTFDWHTSLGLESGAFYAMTMTAPTRGILQIRDRFTGPDRVDVATSLGGITGADSHPAEVYEALALGIRSYEEQVSRADEIQKSRLQAGNAYFVVQSEADVRETLDQILIHDPDHIKVFLRKSDRHAEGYGKWGPGGGISPELLPLIAELSKEAGKRVAVAASNLSDFRAAVNAGAGILTHLPCYQDSASDPESPYYDVDVAEDCLISDEDARQAANIGMVSTIILTEWAKDRPQDLVDWERQNLSKLREAGAPLAIATNAYGSTLTAGLIAAFQKKLIPAPDLLRLATMETPKAIFPKRAVGCLDVGCEASFIGFNANPLLDPLAIGQIEYRLKDGEVIDLAASPS